jgi:hypothetical protein
MFSSIFTTYKTYPINNPNLNIKCRNVMFSKILAPIITPNATAGTMNLSAVFTRVEV